MSAEQVDRVAELFDVPLDLVEPRPARVVASHRRPGRPEPIAPAALGLLAVVLAAAGGGVLVGLLLSVVLT